jgi:hypothetical protein
MATIVDNPKYGEDWKVVLKSKNSGTVLEKFKVFGYLPEQTVLSITVKASNKTAKKYNFIDLGSGDTVIYFNDPSNKLVKVKGSKSTLNTIFNHYSDKGKSNTTVLTEVKENISMWIFQSYVENNRFLSEDDIIQKLGTNAQYYNTVYYESAIMQAKELKTYLKGATVYSYERQQKDLTKKLYDKARKLTGKRADNWNPADVWMIKNDYDFTEMVENCTGKNELNERLTEAVLKKKVVPISLKQVLKSAKLKVIDPASQLNEKLNIDLTYDSLAISETFNNFIIWTKSGFGIRAGFKASSTTLNVSLEGRFKNAGYQTGGVDAKSYAEHVSTRHKYTMRNSSSVSVNSDFDLAVNELDDIFSGNPNISSGIKTKEQALDLANSGDELIKKRFCNLMSVLHTFMDAKDKFADHMTYCYYTSKKISSDNSPYVIIEEG